MSKADEKAQKDAEAQAGVATTEENAKLEHSVSGRTTRDDTHDTGVPMLQGSPGERQGPEDALGVGEKRGDYRERIVGDPHTSVALEGGGQPVYADPESGRILGTDPGDVDGAVIVDVTPTSEVVAQKPRTEEIGDAKGLKGGVDTDPLSPLGAAVAAARDDG